MINRKSRFSVVLGLTIAMLSASVPPASACTYMNGIEAVQLNKSDEDFKYGQYVYVTLKDGTQTVGKIAGKKNSKKYYVKQLDGSLKGVVHKKYIRKMTKEEVENYKSRADGD
ncbi:MAG: hypothetical protein ABJG47_16425 [Ekhidna sp.]